MKLTNQRKAYVGVLAVALAGLVIDRLVGYDDIGPRSAAANGNLNPQRSQSNDLVQSSIGQAISADLWAGMHDQMSLSKPTIIGVAAQLEQLEQEATVDRIEHEDAFAVSSELVGMMAAVPVNVGSGSGSAGSSVGISIRKITLTSTVVPQGRSDSAYAVINGITMTIGSELGAGNDRWRVESIHERSVTLRNPEGIEQILKLADSELK